MLSATRLFVRNLPENAEEREIKAAFSCFGEITTLDIKSKAATQDESKKFAFVSLAAPNEDIEACIKHFGNKDFKGNRLYVTRARESFLERLQRERDQAQIKEKEKNTKTNKLPKKNPVLKLSDKLNPRKRKFDSLDETKSLSNPTKVKVDDNYTKDSNNLENTRSEDIKTSIKEIDIKKNEAEKKRLESMKKKRQEFKQKQMIIKTGLTGVDNMQNKKVIFSDNEDVSSEVNQNNIKAGKGGKNTLFEEDNDSDDGELNFEVKKQFEGMNGQKILDLQSRYKSDKRFTLDEKFIDEEEKERESESHSGVVELGTADERATQMNILQDVLGYTIKQRPIDTDNKKNKPKLGMLRFDPLQPDHAKFLAPVEAKPDITKKSKKKGKDRKEEVKEITQAEVPKVEVSKEQFYNVSETLKEAIAQPTTFSLRSLFGRSENDDEDNQKKNDEYIPLETPKSKEKKIKNPLDPTERNPFVYDSSDSETEEPEKIVKQDVAPTETKAVWKENLFFTEFDTRLKEGLLYFTKPPESDAPKERRELRSLMKKRIYNKDKKNQMFKKKIGGKRKSLKKPYKNKG